MKYQERFSKLSSRRVLLVTTALLSAGFVFQYGFARQTQTASNKSVVGIDFKTICLEENGNVWVGGSVWLSQGLLVHYDGVQIRAKLLENVSTIQDLIFIGQRTGWMIADYNSLYMTR